MQTDATVVPVTRRSFVKHATAIASTVTLLDAFPFVSTSHASQDTPVRIGLVGCGSRGVDAGNNAMASAPNVKVTALAEVFDDRARSAAEHFKVTPDRVFVGFDAIEKICALPDIDYVILATPPGFRPGHFETAIKAGKHVFAEKPVAVDAPGIRQFLAAGEMARGKKLCVAAGTQRRHQAVYQDAIKQIHDGALGNIICLRAYWNGGYTGFPSIKEATEMKTQVRNWYYFRWLSGDHIVEQHVHNLDVCNWIMNDHPIRACGMGGRQEAEYKGGDIYNHFAVEFEYRNGVRLFSQCRQIDNTDTRVSEAVIGTKGTLEYVAGGLNYSGPKPNPYEMEHADLIAAIRGTGPYLNEARNVAESTMTAIMGRESAYSGHIIQWDEAIEWKTSLLPTRLDWNAPAPKVEYAMPGKHDMV